MCRLLLYATRQVVFFYAWDGRRIARPIKLKTNIGLCMCRFLIGPGARPGLRDLVAATLILFIYFDLKK
jgi:hypothetical protein